MFDDSIRDLLGFNARSVYEDYNLSNNPVDIMPFDNIFLECDIVQGMIFNCRKSNIVHNFTMTVSPGYKYVEMFSGGFSWYMMQSKDIISSICFKLKNEKDQLVSFNGQSLTFRLSIKEIWVISTRQMPKILIKLRLNSNKYKPKIKHETNDSKTTLPPSLQSL